MAEKEKPRMPIESGAPDGWQYMHPALRKNYGLWDYHDRPRPGVLHHVSKMGDEVWTVRVGTQRILDIFSLRKLMDIIDEKGDSYVRFTIRSNIEVTVTDQSKVDPLIAAMEEAGFVVGGTGPSVAMLSYTQGWLHWDIPGTDGSGVVKSMMDELIEEFKSEKCLIVFISQPRAARLTVVVRVISRSTCNTPSHQKLIMI
jgi:sulfite reductase beta subunit